MKKFHVECITADDEIIETGEIEADSLKQCIEALVKAWDDVIPAETHHLNISQDVE